MRGDAAAGALTHDTRGLRPNSSWLVKVVAALRRAGGRLAPHWVSTGSARTKYQALLTMLPPDVDEPKPVLSWPAVRGVVGARDHSTGDGQLLSALVTTQDGGVPRGDSHLTVTLVVVGPHPDDCLGVGDSFMLWRGTDIARGTITRRLFV
jgi:hypothetical protein